MDYSRKRSAAVTVVAVLAILGSLFLLLCCAVVFFGMLVKLPSTTPEVPPFMRIALLATEGLMMCLSLFGMATGIRSEEHTSELQSQSNLVCRLLLEKQ